MMQFKRIVPLSVVLAAAWSSGSAHAEDSNRNKVRADLVKDGWRIIWGKNFTEADWVRGTKAIAESVAAENPGPFLAWFENTLQENFAKIERNLAGVTRADLERWVVQSLKAKRPITFKGLRIDAGFATYNRWQRTVVEVPDGIQFQGVKSKVKMKKIENKIPLPNWHQFYVRYKIEERKDAGSATGKTMPGDRKAEIKYTIKNDSGRLVRFQMQPSGKSYALESGRTFSGTSFEVNGKAPTIKLTDSGRTYKLTSGSHKFWWMSNERRVGFASATASR